MKKNLLIVLRWIGVIILPIPCAIILPRMAIASAMMIGAVEPGDLLGIIVAALMKGFVLVEIPYFIAPNGKYGAAFVSALFYFLTGLYFTVVLMGDVPWELSCGHICSLLGIVAMAILLFMDRRSKNKAADKCRSGEGSRKETHPKHEFSKSQKIPCDALGECRNSVPDKVPIMNPENLFDLLLSIYGMDFLQPQSFVEYPHLSSLKMGKIFELCHVATVYGFAVGNPKHPYCEQSIRSLQRNAEAAADFQQLAAFMLMHYNNDVLKDIIAIQHCTKNAAIMLGVTNWLLLELLGDHQPCEVVPLTMRISKLLLGLTFDDHVAKQMELLRQMQNDGLSLAEIEDYFIVKRANELSQQCNGKADIDWHQASSLFALDSDIL